jgi:hypothetical protein
MRFQHAMAVGVLLSLTGCALIPHKAKHAADTPPVQPPPVAVVAIAPQRVGRVAMVNTELGFVLVDVGSLYTPAAGTALKSFRAGTETGVLAVSPEKQRPFIVGDIVKGTPQVGDDVEQ